MTKKERLASELMKTGALQVACALESDLAYYNDSDTFTKEFIDFLTEIRTERNFFVHNVFKEDLFTKAFQDNPKQYIPRLQELIAKMHVANDELVKIFAKMKKEVKMIY